MNATRHQYTMTRTILVVLLAGCTIDNSNDPIITTTGAPPPQTTGADTTAGQLEACEATAFPIGDGIFGTPCLEECMLTCDDVCDASGMECTVAQVNDVCWDGGPIFDADRATCSTPVELSPAVGRCFCTSASMSGSGSGAGSGGGTGGSTSTSTSTSTTTSDSTSTGGVNDVSEG